MSEWCLEQGIGVTQKELGNGEGLMGSRHLEMCHYMVSAVFHGGH